MSFAPSAYSGCRCMPCSGRGASRFDVDVDVDELGAVDPSTRSSGVSQNGWPADKDPAKIDVISVSVPGLQRGKTTIQVARKAAPAIVEMIQWWDRTIEKVTQIGVYNYRNIRGSSDTLSNHSSGTAVDINWDKHPLGAESGKDGIPVALRSLISAKAASLGMRWGGDYSHRKDAMHTELKGGYAAQAVAAVTDAATSVTSSPWTLALLAALGWAGYRASTGKSLLPGR